MSYILLTSAAQDQASTRSYNEFDSTDDLAKLLIGYYESYLLDKERMQIEAGEIQNDNNQNLEYASDELMDFIDKFFAEMVCLKRQPDSPDLWEPNSTSWVKEKVYLYLRSQCEGLDDDDDVMEIEQCGAIAAQ